MSGRWFSPRHFCVGPGWAGMLGTAGAGGAAQRRLPVVGGPCTPPGVRFADLSGVVAADAAGCAVSEGMRGFTVEFTLLLIKGIAILI